MTPQGNGHPGTDAASASSTSSPRSGGGASRSPGGDVGPGGAAAPRPTCKCGHDRTHFMVSGEGKYSVIGWFWVTVMGVTTRPLEVVYRCRTCGQSFDRTKEPAVLDSLA